MSKAGCVGLHNALGSEPPERIGIADSLPQVQLVGIAVMGIDLRFSTNAQANIYIRYVGIAIVMEGKGVEKISITLQEQWIPVLWKHRTIGFRHRSDPQIVHPSGSAALRIRREPTRIPGGRHAQDNLLAMTYPWGHSLINSAPIILPFLGLKLRPVKAQVGSRDGRIRRQGRIAAPKLVDALEFGILLRGSCCLCGQRFRSRSSNNSRAN